MAANRPVDIDDAAANNAPEVRGRWKMGDELRSKDSLWSIWEPL